MTIPGRSPTVDVVLTCYSDARWNLLVDAITSVLSQSYQCLVTVVVDHNDRLVERLISTFGDQIRVMSNSFEQGASGTRNTGALGSSSDFVAFLDDDARADTEWLARLVAVMEASNVIGAGPSIVARWDRRPSWFPDEFGWVVGVTSQLDAESPVPVRNVWSNGMIVRADSFKRAGGFRTDFGKVGTASEPEDTELCLRLSARNNGKQWLYVPAAKIEHAVPPDRSTLSYFIRRCWLEGSGKANLVGTGPRLTVALSEEFRYIERLLRLGFRWNRSSMSQPRPRPAIQLLLIALGLVVTVFGFGTTALSSAMKRLYERLSARVDNTSKSIER